MVPDFMPQLVGNNGLPALGAAIAEPERWAIEPKVDGGTRAVESCRARSNACSI
jgi:hypothetical protein